MDMASMDPNQFALLVLQHATSGNWRALAAIAVLAVVFLIRTYALSASVLAKMPRLAWLKTDKGGVALNFIVSALGGVGNALMAHAPITKELLLTAVVNSCIAAGVFVTVKRLAGKPAEKTPEPAPAPAPAPEPDPASITTTTTTEQPK